MTIRELPDLEVIVKETGFDKDVVVQKYARIWLNVYDSNPDKSLKFYAEKAYVNTMNYFQAQKNLRDAKK